MVLSERPPSSKSELQIVLISFSDTCKLLQVLVCGSVCHPYRTEVLNNLNITIYASCIETENDEITVREQVEIRDIR